VHLGGAACMPVPTCLLARVPASTAQALRMRRQRASMTYSAHRFGSAGRNPAAQGLLARIRAVHGAARTSLRRPDIAQAWRSASPCMGCKNGVCQDRAQGSQLGGSERAARRRPPDARRGRRR